MPVKLIAIVSLSCLPFLFTLDGDFVFDDSEAIVKNEDVTSDSWTELFTHDFWGAKIKSNFSHKSYRPLTVLSFKLNYFLNNRTLSAFQFKVTNLVCHVICCLLVWKVFQTLTSRKVLSVVISESERLSRDLDSNKYWWRNTPFLATLLFSVHPVHVEAVCGAVGRADILAAITFFLAILCYSQAQAKDSRAYCFLLSTIFLAGMSMLFKENGITVLGFCIVYEVVTKLKINRIESRTARILSLDNITVDSMFRVSAMLTSILTLMYARWAVMGNTRPEFKSTDNPAAFASDPFVKVATHNYIYFLNLLLFVWPQWLCYDWSMGCIRLVENMRDTRMVLVYSMYIFGMYMLETMYSGRNMKITNRIMFFAVSLVVLPFLPAANILYPVGFVIAERILYIPSAGYCLLIAIGFNKLLDRRSTKFRKIALLTFMSVVMLYGVWSWRRSYDWQNEYSLFISGMAVCPLNAKVHYNIAKIADANKQYDMAISEYKEAIRLYPQYYQAMNNLANLLKNRKQYTEAERYLRLAVKNRFSYLNRDDMDDFPAAWMNLGILLASTNRLKESEAAYKTALNHRKNYPDCYYNLGNLYLEMNKTEAAIESWLRAINQSPKHVLAWTNLLALMDNTGQIDRALEIIPQALKELPEAPAVNFAIANMYGKLSRYEDAETHFLKAIKLFDKDIKAIHYANLGVLYHRWKKYRLAEEMYTKALKIDPSFKTAQKNLVSLQKRKIK
ncbi:unnamed protein product [Spodoptera littoralis]|uniref:dolichyl-phosphate-mannose--protein mannosyltransferase n=1 Tax=Spodoptera littoralis TaxID=7109 RepID=A0A9P0IAU1_SPOLI|nr:unnamed protein product [Spodoptera littoralis]CAH1643422.1 unnamed protein product [Spodoptera littoralis]